jgi:hypothetical protein
VYVEWERLHGPLAELEHASRHVGRERLRATARAARLQLLLDQRGDARCRRRRTRKPAHDFQIEAARALFAEEAEVGRAQRPATLAHRASIYSKRPRPADPGPARDVLFSDQCDSCTRGRSASVGVPLMVPGPVEQGEYQDRLNGSYIRVAAMLLAPPSSELAARSVDDFFASGAQSDKRRRRTSQPPHATYPEPCSTGHRPDSSTSPIC